jgi:predicted RNase H-like nuclease
MKQIYKITYPTGKIYIGKDSVGSFRYFGTPAITVVNEDFANLPKQQQMDYSVRKQILWESEDCSEKELLEKEVAFIREFQSNNPEIGYNRWPTYRLDQSDNNVGWRLGVDGCKDGWFYVASNGNDYQLGIVENISELFSKFTQIDEVLIDIPIGLWNDGYKPRACDVEARKKLKPRGSTVFPAPLRPCLFGASYTDACQISERLSGKKLSQQAYNIFEKIKQVDNYLLEHPEIRTIIKETHPEVGFCMLNAGQPLLSKKKDSLGLEERLELLTSTLGFAETVYHEAISHFKRKQLAKDDIVDALMCLAISMAPEVTRKTIPEKPEYDDSGIEMAIHYRV